MKKRNKYPQLIFETTGGIPNCYILYPRSRSSMSFVTQKQLMDYLSKEIEKTNPTFFNECITALHESQIPFSFDAGESTQFAKLPDEEKTNVLTGKKKLADFSVMKPMIQKYEYGGIPSQSFVVANLFSATFTTKEEGYQCLQELMLVDEEFLKDEHIEDFLKLLTASKEIPGKVPVPKRND